jgi:hypothetical protein
MTTRSSQPHPKFDRLDFIESTEDAHMAASQAMLASADRQARASVLP